MSSDKNSSRFEITATTNEETVTYKRKSFHQVRKLVEELKSQGYSVSIKENKKCRKNQN
jgi:hypothetical protein